MSVGRRKSSRSLAYFVGLAVILTLAVPFATRAVAQVTGDNSFGLEVQPETDTNPTGTNHTLTATLYTQTTSGVTGQQQTVNCDRPAGCEIDFEIESGPAVTVVSEDPPVAGSSRPRTTDSTNSPESPDMSCLIANGTNSCSVVFSSSTAGEDIIRAWVDDDRSNTTHPGNSANPDADATEGRNAGASDCVAGTPNPSPAGFTSDTAADCSNTGAVVGSRSERDDTDVVSKTWFAPTAGTTRLDCDDDDNADTETNPAGQSETYTCSVFNDADADNTFDAGEAVSGARIDAENLDGANDTDDASATPADFNDACTTGSGGTCTFSFVPTRGEVGVANLCFWVDDDTDAEFTSVDAREFDGGLCDNETATSDEPSTNKTDVVQKTWAAAGVAASLDAEPERDSNLKGTQHTVTATVTDQFGGPAPGVKVDFNIEGANDGADPNCNAVLTNASGVATCSYTDSTTTVGPEPETDTIDACVDANDDNICEAGTEATDEVDADLTDRVEKFWFTTFPTASSVIVDMVGGPNAADCDDAADSTATNPVETNHDFCGIVRDAAGAAIAGKNVTLTVTGVGNFVNEGSTSGNTGAARDDDVSLGASITVTTDATGIYRATITSIKTGTSTVTATADNATDTGTKTWTALADGARTLNCEPETGTNEPGTEHVITCTALDRLGNPVPGEGLTATESGPGRFVGDPNAAVTGTDGTAEIVVSSTATETGAQTITVSLDDDADDPTPLTRDAAELQDECDRVAGDPAATGSSPAGPEGVCADQVTKTWEEEPPPEETECSDGIDNDGDGDIDLADRGCTSAADDSEAGEEEDNATNLTIRYQKKTGDFKGAVGSDRKRCQTNRRVVLKKVVRGPNRIVGRDTSNRFGNWKIHKPRARGRFYAVARPKTFTDGTGTIVNCLRDRSVTIKVGRRR